MKIKTQFNTSILAFGALLVVIFASLGATYLKTTRLHNQGALAAKVEQDANELSYVSNEFLIYRESQYVTRWNAKYHSITAELAKLEIDNPDKKAHLDRMKGNLQRVREVFDDSASASRTTSPTPSSEAYATKTLWSRMGVQNQELARAASQLSQLYNDEERALNRANLVLICCLIAACGGYIGTSNFLVYKRVFKSLAKLEAGTKIIGSGNLQYSIEATRDDEIGALCLAFNEMTSELGRSYRLLESEVAQRKQAQEALRRINDELELRVEQRTAELARAVTSLQVEHAERMKAVEESREKDRLLIQQNRLAAMGEMLQNIAHQWRQPLNVLGMNIQHLELDHELGLLDSDSLRRSTEGAMKLIQHMSQTIDDFRNFFKPDREKTTFSVNQAIQLTLSLVGDSLRNYNIEVVTNVRGAPSITGYYNEFCHAVLNIAQNARDALVERKIKGGKVVIASWVEGGRAVITITDNAGGIPEEVMGRIFEPYFSTKAVQGTGIGLFMAKNIIEGSMSGSITARNVPDGAEFRIEMRAVPDASGG